MRPADWAVDNASRPDDPTDDAGYEYLGHDGQDEPTDARQDSLVIDDL